MKLSSEQSYFDENRVVQEKTGAADSHTSSLFSVYGFTLQETQGLDAHTLPTSSYPSHASPF